MGDVLNELPLLQLGGGVGLLTTFVFFALKLLSGREQDQGWEKLVENERLRADRLAADCEKLQAQLRTAEAANTDLQNTLIDLERERMRGQLP